MSCGGQRGHSRGPPPGASGRDRRLRPRDAAGGEPAGARRPTKAHIMKKILYGALLLAGGFLLAALMSGCYTLSNWEWEPVEEIKKFPANERRELPELREEYRRMWTEEKKRWPKPVHRY